MSLFLLINQNKVLAAEYQDTYIPEDIQTECEIIADSYNISAPFVMALIEKESSGKEDAENGDCVGLMQISYNSHKKLIESLGYTEDDLYESEANIEIGCAILEDLFKTYSDPAVVLMIYNGYGVRESIGRAIHGEISKHAKKVLERAYEIERARGY